MSDRNSVTFFDQIFADPDLQNTLAAIEEPAAFIAALPGNFDRDVVERRLRPDPLGIDRFDDAPAVDKRWPGPGWLPIAVTPVRGQTMVDWAHFGGARLTEPFFEESLRIARRRPLNRLLRWRTTLSTLVSGWPQSANATPTGLIFHMSRCGSTLAAQMLAATPEHVVVSEAPPFDAVVQIAQRDADSPIAERLALVRAMAAALGRTCERGQAYFIKLDSWHTLALPLFRLAFPDTPWLFLYRNPVEVLVSHTRMRGLQTVPGVMDDIFGIADAPVTTGEEHIARRLAQICEAALEHRNLGGGLLVDYRELPEAAETRILPHFGIVASAGMRAAMRTVAARNAKSPALSFARDVEDKQRAATVAVRAAVAAHLAQPYHRLDAIRRQHRSDA
jgi:hypothetical protein